MAEKSTLPKLITFDGEARSGKGTIVQAVKDSLRDDLGYKVMLIDAGQVFRCLVVAAKNRKIDVDSPAAIDEFLSDDESAESCVQFVKAVYHMEKIDRDALIYTNEVGANSAKFGARPLSQEFKDSLLRKWMRDAASEGYEIVLLDGRALEETGDMLVKNNLCDFVAGYYFVCDPVVGARRTLGYAHLSYEELNSEQKAKVDQLIEQIIARNHADRERKVQPIVPPADAPIFTLPNIDIPESFKGRFMATIDSSAEISKKDMTEPVIDLTSALLSD